MLKNHLDGIKQQDWRQTDIDDPIQFALIGVGSFARELVLPAVSDSEDCGISVLVTGHPDKASDVASTYGIEHVITYEEFGDGREQDAYDAVYIATPNAHHLPYARAAAELGKHVFCEKPLEASEARAAEIVTTCEEAGVFLATAYRVRTDPAIRRVRELVADGIIGQPIHAYGAFGLFKHEETAADEWRLNGELAGGGPLYDLGVYPINTLRFLLGSDPHTARGRTWVDRPMFGSVEEHCSFDLRFDGPVRASFWASYGTTFDNRLHILGTEGKVVISDAFHTLRVRDIEVTRGDTTVTMETESINEIREEFEYFAHAIATDSSPAELGTGYQDMVIMDAIYESAETGTEQEINIVN